MKMSFTSNKKKAKQLLDEAITQNNQGETAKAITLYDAVIRLDPQWAVPHYNVGLLYKYDCNWDKSYYHNTLATQIDETDEAAWWNLGHSGNCIK